MSSPSACIPISLSRPPFCVMQRSGKDMRGTSSLISTSTPQFDHTPLSVKDVDGWFQPGFCHERLSSAFRGHATLGLFVCPLQPLLCYMSFMMPSLRHVCLLSVHTCCCAFCWFVFSPGVVLRGGFSAGLSTVHWVLTVSCMSVTINSQSVNSIV